MQIRPVPLGEFQKTIKQGLRSFYHFGDGDYWSYGPPVWYVHSQEDCVSEQEDLFPY